MSRIREWVRMLEPVVYGTHVEFKEIDSQLLWIYCE